MSLTKLRWYIALSKPIKPTQLIFKRPNKKILLSMMLDNSDVQYTNITVIQTSQGHHWTLS